MNTTRLQQGASIATWIIATIGISIAIPWLLATLALAIIATTGGTVMVQQALANLATLDGLQWRTSVPAFWAGLTWLSAAVVFAYRITQSQWTRDSVDRLATRTGAWIQIGSRALYIRLGGTPNEAGRLSIALVSTLALVLIAAWLWLLAEHNPARRNAPEFKPTVRPSLRASAALLMPTGSVVSGSARIDQVGEGVYRVTFGDRPEALK
ncbi:hypothetical protein [Burkholderia gladioli]|uniref:hypothetical protein n=1 Tax=Burkholderia gladioli TaxID=28095 RepID=UPI000BBD3642|nr:hypothetical protein [Burkholderia gladioli]ATF90508.1 hypothetical protein CO712_36090 [Burkholderia gladioli pv. gladioli]MBJ9711304.1 hypothetical protein [Burkholderia gladioli]MDN7499578.1 hypothetical protein [Burkholderia gladioli]MDR8086160.1 hypothetical protein [Burkholderia gladioli]MDZ4041462.1 hypothetical protein [Burkholderia gladioli pv. alliicola]